MDADPRHGCRLETVGEERGRERIGVRVLHVVFAAAGLLLAFAAMEGSSSAAQRIRFEDVAETMGIRHKNIFGSAQKKYIVESTGSGGCFLDYDGDGFIDLYVVHGATFEREPGQDVLYRNQAEQPFKQYLCPVASAPV